MYQMSQMKKNHWYNAGLVVNYGISNAIVLEIPQFTTKPAIWYVNFHNLMVPDSTIW